MAGGEAAAVHHPLRPLAAGVRGGVRAVGAELLDTRLLLSCRNVGRLWCALQRGCRCLLSCQAVTYRELAISRPHHYSIFPPARRRPACYRLLASREVVVSARLVEQAYMSSIRRGSWGRLPRGTSLCASLGFDRRFGDPPARVVLQEAPRSQVPSLCLRPLSLLRLRPPRHAGPLPRVRDRAESGGN